MSFSPAESKWTELLSIPYEIENGTKLSNE